MVQTGKQYQPHSRLASRAGYTVLIALLGFSVIEAYRVQGTLSRQSVEIYRQYVRQDHVLFQLRQDVWRGSVYARDFFLNPDVNRASRLRSQVKTLRTACAANMAQLTPLGLPEAYRGEITSKVNEYWDTLDLVADSMIGVTGLPADEFVQKEIVPRRSATSEALRGLSHASQAVVEASEREFDASRRAGGQRVLAMLGLALICGLVVAGLSIRRTERLEQELRLRYEQTAEARRELEQLSNRLLEVQEEERARLARELHDEIGQTLTALRIELSRTLSGDSALPTEARERLTRARGLAERAVSTVRDISSLLRPSALDDLGLSAALSWQTEDFAQRSGVECEYIDHGVGDHLPDAIRTSAYRIIQEALNNCEKHAAASKVTVEVRETETSLELTVTDNGRGIRLGPGGMPLERRGSGLLGMRERATSLGGSLTLESAEGDGLRIQARLPLEPLPALQKTGNVT